MENKESPSPVSFKTLELRIPRDPQGRPMIDWYGYAFKLGIGMAKTLVLVLTVSMAWRQALVFLLNTFIDTSTGWFSDARGRHRDTRSGDRSKAPEIRK